MDAEQLPACVLALSSIVLAAISNCSATPIVGQIDTFSGATLSWVNGAPAPDPIVVPSGGPAGAGDGYLRITGDGSGAGGRITAFNVSQWAGNYLAAGVGAIDMDLLNLGAVPLTIRVGLRSSTGQGSPGFSSATGFSLAADNTWHHATFLLDSASLTRINSTTLTLDTLLMNVAELRVLHSSNPSLTGTPIVSQLGVDNIRALAVQAIPEPASIVLALSGLSLCGLSRLRSRRSLRRTSL